MNLAQNLFPRRGAGGVCALSERLAEVVHRAARPWKAGFGPHESKFGTAAGTCNDRRTPGCAPHSDVGSL
jgi:hypothetical protein